MDYIKDILNLSSKIVSFRDGLIMLKTRLKLDVASVEASGIQQVDVQMERQTTFKNKPVVGHDSGSDPAITQAFGDRLQMRRATDSVSLATVYGIAQTWRVHFSQHSIFGINKKYIDENGNINGSAIAHKLSELVGSVDLRAQRLNRFVNSVFAREFYDNATTLLVLLHQYKQKLSITERMATYKYKIVLRAIDLGELTRGIPPVMAKQMATILQASARGVGCNENDLGLIDIANEVLRWKETLPDKQILVDGQMRENPEYVNATYELEVTVWKMYSYDDGHSTSGNSFGTEMGFRNGRYLVPKFMNVLLADPPEIITTATHVIPTDDAGIDNFGSKAGYINCSSLTTKNLMILNKVLQGNKRDTPFLIDQDLITDFQVGSIAGFHVPQYSRTQLTISSADVAETISKLVSTHKWHEDSLSAVRALRYWNAQPATETVESHWWLTVNRTLALPRIGLKRAALSILLDDEGVCTTQDAINMYSRTMAKDDCMILESIIANASWYWGEYFIKHNANTLLELLKRHGQYNDITVAYEDRADALVSAVLGRAVPKGNYPQLATFIQGGLDAHKQNRFRFGTISIDNIQDYGYHMDRVDLIVNTYVAPSCVALITGLAGSLIAGTPYSSMFTINQAVKVWDNYMTRNGLNYNDLWAVGVFSRWQGYDVHYEHPRQNGVHRSYCANNVNIAMPPTNPVTIGRLQSYTLKDIRQRGHCFGTTYDKALNHRVTCYWSREQTTVQEQPEYTAYSCGSDTRSYAAIQEYKRVVLTTDNYVAHVLSKFDVVTSGFHVERIVAGVPIPGNTQPLDLPETDNPPPQITDTLQGVGEASNG